MSEHQKATQNSENSLVERLARQLGLTANAKCIYGEPVERDGVTVITVAKAAYGFGGGGGKKENADGPDGGNSKENEEGSGGGGGVALIPVGYIEIKNGETRFRPTRDWLAALPMIAATVPAILLGVWTLTKLFRTFRPEVIRRHGPDSAPRALRRA